MLCRYSETKLCHLSTHINQIHQKNQKTVRSINDVQPEILVSGCKSLMDHMVCYLDTTIWWIQNYVIHKRFLKAWTIFDKTKQQRSGANEIGYQKCHFMCLYLLSFTVRVYYVWFLYFNFNSVLKIISNSLASQRIRYFKIGKNKFALLYNFLANKFRKKNT